MRAVLRVLFLAGLITMAPAVAQTAAPRAIDLAKSTATFSIAHIFVSRVTGSVPIASGSVMLEPGTAIPTAINAVLDAAKIHTDEADRDAALRSSDYFDTDRFPSWTFASTKIVASGPSAFAMEGNLTIHGVSQVERLDVVVRGDATHPSYHAVGQIDRHAFGMKGARLDPVIGKSAEVTLDIVLQ